MPAQHIDIVSILREAIRVGASDLHLVAGGLVAVRLHGELVPLPNMPRFDATETMAAIYQLLSEGQRATLEKKNSVDFSFAVDTSRFRINVTVQRNGLEAVCRIIPSRIPAPGELNLPRSVVKLSELGRGLVLISGPAGAGKSTTLASLIECINNTRKAKIVTIEDPIEFVYTNKQSMISQREVGQHTPSFTTALRDLLRQDPDVILVGEMRDYETIEAAIQVADTGHLVLATLHAADAAQAVDRVVDVFPGDQQQQVRVQLASNLQAVVAQSLLPRKGGGRIAAFDVLMNTQAVSTMIRQSRTHEIPAAMEMGMADGMITFARSLQELMQQGLIEPGLMTGTSTGENHRAPNPGKMRPTRL